ncbi:MAG: hypothetical protein ACYC61_18850 [Isosphaeraceae bacterium]
MSRETVPDAGPEPALARWPTGPGRIAEFVDRHLAAARSEAQAGRMTQARRHLLSLRAGLVGRMPGECAGSPSDGAPSDHHSPRTGRRDWLDAVHLTAQAIVGLQAVVAGSSVAEALDTWEHRHRDRIGRWASRALSARPGQPPA